LSQARQVPVLVLVLVPVQVLVLVQVLVPVLVQVLVQSHGYLPRRSLSL
jgi:hypothetical protein